MSPLHFDKSRFYRAPETRKSESPTRRYRAEAALKVGGKISCKNGVRNVGRPAHACDTALRLYSKRWVNVGEFAILDFTDTRILYDRV